jgi:hypothetical protein
MMMVPSVPFVVVRSSGGPYDDEAFVAGYALGVLSTSLSDSSMQSPFVMPTYANAVKQADLIAMRYGWLTRAIDKMGEWVILQFYRVEDTFSKVSEDKDAIES